MTKKPLVKPVFKPGSKPSDKFPMSPGLTMSKQPDFKLGGAIPGQSGLKKPDIRKPTKGKPSKMPEGTHFLVKKALKTSKKMVSSYMKKSMGNKGKKK